MVYRRAAVAPVPTGGAKPLRHQLLKRMLAVTLTALGFNALSQPFDPLQPYTQCLWAAAFTAIGVGSFVVVKRQRRKNARRRVQKKPFAELHVSRVYAISDVHTDVSANLEWLQRYAAASKETHLNDLIVVAGDISDSIGVIQDTLTLLQSTFGAGVAFVPGNHDLWCNSASDENSIDKLNEIRTLCIKMGVHIEPFVVVTDKVATDPLLVVPLLSWYHESWDTEPDIPGLNLPPVRLAASDFRRCRWPAPLNPLDESLAKYFDNLNTVVVERAINKYPDAQILSFSHFLPFQQLLPEKRMLFYPNLPKMVGSVPLRDRIRKLKPTCHIFGHTHFAWDSKIEGIRFIQAPVGYPSEQNMSGGPCWRPFLLYEAGAFVNYPQPCKWSQYYRENTRNPSNFELAPWVQEKWQSE